MLKHGIMGLLSYGDMTGYEIMQVFRDSLNFFWNANTSQIYRDLQTLKKAGYVTAREVPQKGRPDKKEFSITDAGRDELKSWLREYSCGTANLPLLMKVFFLGEITKKENLERFRQMKSESENSIKALEKVKNIIAVYKERVENPDASLYWKMTLDYGIRYMNMINEWCDTCIAELEGKIHEHTGA